MFFSTNPNAKDLKQTDMIGPHEVIAYVEEQGDITSELDNRITDHHGNILSEQQYLNQLWEETGRSGFDLDKEKVFIYSGKIDNSGRLAIHE